MRLRHILVKQNYEAEDMLRLLGQGQDFAELAKKFSICSSGPLGGDLGEVKAKSLDPDFAEAAEAMRPGEVSGIVRSRFGHHIIRREA